MFDILDNCDKAIPMRFQSLNGSLLVVIYLDFGTLELECFKRDFRRSRKTGLINCSYDFIEAWK